MERHFLFEKSFKKTFFVLKKRLKDSKKISKRDWESVKNDEMMIFDT